MVTGHDTRQHIRRFRLWSDWVLLVAGILVLGVPLDFVADAAYRRDGSVLYWLLISYGYPRGIPTATGIGLTLLALALLAFWLTLRRLTRAGLPPWRALAAVALAALATGCVIITCWCAYRLASGASAFTSINYGLFGAVFGLLAVVLGIGLLAVIGLVGRPRESSAGWRASWALLRPLAFTIAASVVALTLAPLALLLGEGPSTFTHLAGATAQGHHYYLAVEETPSDGSYAVLYRCDRLGVWCARLDTLWTGSEDRQSASGRLRYDPTSRTLTASEGEHVLLATPVGDLFEGP